MDNSVRFQKISFGRKLKSMLKVDFRRMFKSKIFIITILLGIAVMFPVFRKFWQRTTLPILLILQNIVALLILYLSFAFLCGATYNPFIYFRF